MAELEGNLALLGSNGLADFDALFAAAEPHRIDGHRRRSVSRLELREADGKPVVVYVKRQWGRAARRPWRDLVRLRWPKLPARQEWRNVAALRSAGIPVAEPVAFGYSAGPGGPRSLLVFREVRGRSLAALLADLPQGADRGASARARHAVARAAGQAVRRLHDAGFSLPDLYAKHLFIENADGPQVRVVLIDPQRLRRCTPARAVADLAALLATARVPGVRRSDHLRFLEAYLGDGPTRAEARELMRVVVGKAARIAGRGRDPNLMPSRRTAPPGMVPLADEKMVEVDGGRLRVNEVFRPALAAAGLTSLDALMAYRGGETYREVPGRRTVRVELPDPAGGRKTVYLKRYTRVPWRKALLRLFSLGDPVSLALAEGRNIVRLSDAGIATMRIVALGEEVTRRGLAERSCLVTEEIAGAVQADVYCETAFGGDRSRAGTAARRRLIRAIARLAREFHGAGFTHRDLYLCHLLVRPADGADPALHLIDLQRVQHHRRGAGRRRIVKDLAALLFSSEPSPATHIRSKVFTRTDRMRFACEYFGARPLTGGRKDLVRSVIRKADAIGGHERRRRARSGAAG